MITRSRIFAALVLSTSLTGVTSPALPPHAENHILIKFRPDAVRIVERIAELPRMVHALDLPPGCRIEEPAFNRLCRTRAGVTHEANPRINERAPKNNKFKFKIIYLPMKDEDIKITKENIKNLIVCMRFLEDHSLGGNGSRGYGKIKFSDLKLDTTCKTLKDLQIALTTNGQI